MKIQSSTFRPALALILGFVFNALFYLKVPGVSLPLFIGLVLISTFALAQFNKVPFSKTQIHTAFMAFLFSLLFITRAAPELLFTNFCLSLYLTFLFFAPFYLKKEIHQFDFLNYVSLTPKLVSQSLYEGQKDWADRTKKWETKKVPWKRILVGLLISTPLLFIFIWLMMSADLIFKNWFENIWKFMTDHVFEHFLRTIIIILVTFLFSGLWLWIQKKNPKDNKVPSDGDPSRPWGFIESNVVMSLVNVLFVVFSVIQVIFLLGGKARIEALGVTFSQYARQGFWQLVWIAVLNLFIILLIEEKVKNATLKEHLIHKSNLILSVFLTLIIMSSAFVRLWFYEEAYGFTVLRFYSHTLTIFLAVIFILLALKVIYRYSKQKFLYQFYWASLILFFSWNLLNPHRIIASTNIDRHLQGQRELDYFYLRRLSLDASPALIQAVHKDIKTEDRFKILETLSTLKIKDEDKSENRSWPSTRLSSALFGRQLKAVQNLDEYRRAEIIALVKHLSMKGKLINVDPGVRRQYAREVIEYLKTAEMEFWDRWNLGQAFVRLGPLDESFVPDISSLILKYKNDNTLFGPLIISLNQMKKLSPAATSPLLFGLRSGTPAIQKQTLRALAKIGPGALIQEPSLISPIKFLVLNEKEPFEVRKEGLNTLVKIDPNGTKVKPILKKATKSSNHQVRGFAGNMLRRFK